MNVVFNILRIRMCCDVDSRLARFKLAVKFDPDNHFEIFKHLEFFCQSEDCV